MLIMLEARHLNNFENSFKQLCKYRVQSILDDKIIGSCCLYVLNFDSMYSSMFDVKLIKILKAYQVLDLLCLILGGGGESHVPSPLGHYY